jgi:FkbM family methyltransferase
MTQGIDSHLVQFWRKPAADKLRSLRYHFKTGLWNRLCPRIPLPTRLPYGGWWLAGNDLLSDAVFAGVFEGPDVKFLERFLVEATTVIDIGAHLGFYTLLMSSKVGAQGRVLAFEPSPREFRHLKTHLRINGRANVRSENVALADRSGSMELFLTRPPGTTGNSLRRPEVNCVQSVNVPVVTLDEYLSEKDIQEVDLIKLDAEGAELKILAGAVGLLSRSRRPLILCEINDPVIGLYGWEHRGEDVIEFLESRSFRWYALNAEGSPIPLVKSSSYCTDLIAVPEERARESAVAARGETVGVGSMDTRQESRK